MGLRKCPFCNNDAVYIVRNECLENGFVSYSMRHRYTNCVLDDWQSHNAYTSEEECILAWNHRY